jgi:hypothetical protein
LCALAAPLGWTVSGLRISRSRCRRAVSSKAGLAVAPGTRLATGAGLGVRPRVVRRTTPLRGEAWWRRLHPGIVTAVATCDQDAIAGRGAAPAELSIDEAANAAGVPTAVLHDAGSERPVPPDAAAAIETLIAQLSMS